MTFSMWSSLLIPTGMAAMLGIWYVARWQMARVMERPPAVYQFLQYSRYAEREMDYITSSLYSETVMDAVVTIWLVSLGRMDDYQKLQACSSDACGYRTQLGLLLTSDSELVRIYPGVRFILTLRPEAAAVPALDRLLSGMGWERDSAPVRQSMPREDTPYGLLPQEAAIARQYTADGVSLYAENGDE